MTHKTATSVGFEGPVPFDLVWMTKIAVVWGLEGLQGCSVFLGPDKDDAAYEDRCN
jgi:hypothetical protein